MLGIKVLLISHSDKKYHGRYSTLIHNKYFSNIQEYGYVKTNILD